MTFSGNRYQTNYYATGLSQFTGGATGDPTAAANWQELDTASAQWFGGLNGTANGVWGAAAVRGFTAPGDSNEAWVVYHAYPQYCDFCTDNREAYVQPQTWSSNNLPTFNGGVPLGNQSVQLPAGDPGAASFSGCYTLHNESTGNELWQTGDVYNSVAGVYYLVDVPGGWTGNYAVWRLTLQSNGYYTITSEGQDGQLWITGDSYGGPSTGYLYVVTVPTAWTGDFRYWSVESSGNGNNYIVSKSNPTLELQETGDNYNGASNVFYTAATPTSWNASYQRFSLTSVTCP